VLRPSAAAPRASHAEEGRHPAHLGAGESIEPRSRHRRCRLDHAFLFTMLTDDGLTEWEFETRAEAGLGRELEVQRSELPLVLQYPRRRHLSRTARRSMPSRKIKPRAATRRSESNINADLASGGSVEVTGPLQATLSLNTADAALPGSSPIVRHDGVDSAESEPRRTVARKPVCCRRLCLRHAGPTARRSCQAHEKYWKRIGPA